MTGAVLVTERFRTGTSPGRARARSSLDSMTSPCAPCPAMTRNQMSRAGRVLAGQPSPRKARSSVLKRSDGRPFVAGTPMNAIHRKNHRIRIGRGCDLVALLFAMSAATAACSSTATTDGDVKSGSGGAMAGTGGSRSNGGIQLQGGSPAINNGAVIANNGGFDFWNTPLYVGAPDIGPFEAP